MEITPNDNQIVHLAYDISEADDHTIPILLLKLRDILSGKTNSKDDLMVIRELWKYELPSMILTALEQDYSLISGSWLTACQLSSLVVECCVGYTSNPKTLKDDFIPNLVIILLKNITKIISDYNKAEKLFKENLLGNLSLMITSLTSLMEFFTYISCSVLSSKHFMQFLMMEDPKLSLLALALLKNIIKISSSVFDHITESRTHSISDELTFKIASTGDANVARISISILLVLMTLYAPLMDLFATKRYRGFKMYLNKWKNNGFDYDVDKLTRILDVQTEQQLPTNKHRHAAITIQSFYRGYSLRKRLTRAYTAIGKFQRLYRRRRLQRLNTKEYVRFKKQKREYTESKRRREFVDSRTKQLKVIEKIPARTVTKFLDDLEHEAARKIQAAWLGCRTRRSMATRQPTLMKEKAAVLLQRQIRKWLAYRRKRRSVALLDLIPSGLTDERKTELQDVISKIRERFPNASPTDEELRDIHDKAFRMLNNHVIGLRQVRRNDDHRKALLAQLSIQMQQLSHMPSLSSVSEPEIQQKFCSYSTPIIVAARQKHVETLNDKKKRWWEKLNSVEHDFHSNVLVDYPSGYIQDHEKQF